MIHVIKGDLLKSDCQVVGHQVNCQGVMGAGLALAVATEYPMVYHQYKQLLRERGLHALGMCQLVQVDDDRWVANLFGQNRYGRGKQFTSYPALRSALEQLRDEAPVGAKIGLPYGIGCGLAGGQWSVVKEMLGEVFVDGDVYLYKL